MTKSTVTLKGLTLCALASVLAAGMAQAATTSTTTKTAASATTAAPAASASGSTTLTESVASSSILDKISVSYTAWLFGSSISDPLSGTQTDINTGKKDLSSPLKVKNYLNPTYKLSESVTVGPVLYWTYEARNRGLTMKDPYIKITNGKIYSNGNLNVLADLRASKAVTDASDKAGLTGYFASKTNTTYTIPNSRFTLGFLTFVEYDLRNGKAAPTANRYTIEGQPTVEYKVRSNLSATLYYDLNGKNTINKGFFDVTDDGTGLGPGLSWDITPAVNFSPWLEIKTGNRVATDTTQIQAILSWKLL